MNKKEKIFKSIMDNYSEINKETLENFYEKWVMDYTENLILHVLGDFFFLDLSIYPLSDNEMGYTTVYSDLKYYF